MGELALQRRKLARKQCFLKGSRSRWRVGIRFPTKNRLRRVGVRRRRLIAGCAGQRTAFSSLARLCTHSQIKTVIAVTAGRDHAILPRQVTPLICKTDVTQRGSPNPPPRRLSGRRVGANFVLADHNGVMAHRPESKCR
jgi:hypothetical protein